jgi:hypothetical protein
MTKRVFRHTRRRRSGVGRSLLSSAFLIVLGGGLFWGGMNWLRSGAPSAETLAVDSGAVTDLLSPGAASAAEPMLMRADVIAVGDKKPTGVANRTPGEKGADYHLIVYLPGIDAASETYAVWLLKDGLADVKRMGDLLPRADGSWVSDFTANALSGIAEPDAYRTLVIMKEQKSEEEKGQKIAEASF